MKMVLGIILGYAHAKAILKNSIKGILYDFEKKMKNFTFQFLMKICCRHDLRMSALRG